MKVRRKRMMYISYHTAAHPMNTAELRQEVVDILPLEKHHSYGSGDHTHLSSNGWKWRLLTISSAFPPSLSLLSLLLDLPSSPFLLPYPSSIFSFFFLFFFLSLTNTGFLNLPSTWQKQTSRKRLAFHQGSKVTRSDYYVEIQDLNNNMWPRCQANLGLNPVTLLW